MAAALPQVGLQHELAEQVGRGQAGFHAVPTYGLELLEGEGLFNAEPKAEGRAVNVHKSETEAAEGRGRVVVVDVVGGRGEEVVVRRGRALGNNANTTSRAEVEGRERLLKGRGPLHSIYLTAEFCERLNEPVL